MEITATPPVRGVNIPIRSIAEAKPAPAAAHRPMTTPITAIPMARGSSIRPVSIGAQVPAETAARQTMIMPATV